MNIAILTPTRNRIKRYHTFLESIRDTRSGNHDIRCYNYIDTDDPSIDLYKQSHMLKDTDISVTNIYGESMSVSKSWNILAEQALSDGADVLMMGNDDQVYITKNWDNRVEDLDNIWPDKIYLGWFEDKINGAKHCAFPIVSKTWVDTLGYFTPGIFHFGCNDGWIFRLGKLVERTKFLSDVVVEHRHMSKDGSLWDDTYARNRTQQKGNLYAKDKAILNNSVGMLQEHANKLKQVIRGT